MNYFAAPDGAKIAYDVEGQGRPLVLLHGLMAHRGFFRFQRSLASDFRLLSIDLRGHGESLPGGEAPKIERLAADVAALTEELDLKDAIGVGWSLGATVLWHLLTGPAAYRFAGSVIIDMTPMVRNEGDWELGLSSELCEARSAAIRDDFESFAVNAGQAVFAQPLDKRSRDIAAWSSEQFARNDAASIDAVWASLAEQDMRARLGRIEQPTLIVHGAQSQLYGSDTAEYLAEALPDAKALRFEASGHAPHMEQPELFNAAIRQFAASLPRVRETQITN